MWVRPNTMAYQPTPMTTASSAVTTRSPVAAWPLSSPPTAGPAETTSAASRAVASTRTGSGYDGPLAACVAAASGGGEGEAEDAADRDDASRSASRVWERCFLAIPR